ncbi:MAG: aldehyde:ferredoxin oxidoreductase [Candidatus Bipolaricaulota bacterium]|nr:aldehyde:ferredoxin oxidoreductase [Candidatus Bipolaricaulota bacterium]
MGVPAGFRVITELPYKSQALSRGYTNRTLYVNVGTGKIESRPVTQQMKDVFIGGKGFGLWRLWNAVKPETKWNDAENEIVVSSGPVGGTTAYPGSGKSLVVSLSPLTGNVIDSNVGGYFGPYLKFSGWDALELQGKTREDVVVFIDGTAGIVQILACPKTDINTHVFSETLMRAFAASEEPRDIAAVSTITTGAGADHSRWGCLNFSFFDLKRKAPRIKQAGRGGIGTVFRDKGIAAVVVRSPAVRPDSNAPADLPKLQAAGARISKEILDLDQKQCDMRRVGTAHLVEVMDEYDLLPTHNYRYGTHPDSQKIASTVWRQRFGQNMPDSCWIGCTMSCSHAVDNFLLRTGPYKGERVLVDGPEYETAAGSANLGVFDPDFVLEMNFYCDTYGIDTISFTTGLAFVMECYEAGILDAAKTGGLDLRFGNGDAALETLHQMAKGQGFGVVVGQGIRLMKDHFVREFGADRAFLDSIGMEAKGLEYSEYVTKESLAMQGGYGLALKGPQHDEAWLIFMDMVNNQIPTFEDKAEALHYFPMWRTWFGLVGHCKLPWNDIEPADNAKTTEPAKVPAHVANYCEVFSGVTGVAVQPADLIRQSERVYNFQRVFGVRMGYGTRTHDRIPYRSAGPVTTAEYESRSDRYDKQLVEKLGLDPSRMTTEAKVAALRAHREEQYEKLTDAVYKRRGWTANGVPTLAKLKELGIDFPEVVAVVRPHQ